MVRRRKTFMFALGLLLLAACGKAAKPPTKTPLPPTAAATPTAVPPTATPTPAPPTAVLLVAPHADAGLKDAAQAWLQAWAKKAGARFVVQGAKDALPPHTVAALGVGIVPPAARGARRIVIAPPQGAALKGAQVVDPATAGLPQRAFLGGYLAAITTYDWRGGLLASEGEKTAAAAFVDGERYFCGLCRPLHPPFLAYPRYVLAPANASAQAWQAAWQQLKRAGVATLALSPAALTGLPPDGLPAKMPLIALGEYPHGTPARFIAAIHPNLAAALNTLWEHPNDASTPLPLTVEALDAEKFPPGKRRLVEAVRAKLQAGQIQP
jgi:hypothetical protein